MAERTVGTDTPSRGAVAHANGWDRPYQRYDDANLPTYVGPVSFMKLPWVTDPDELRRREVDVAIVGAPFDDAVTHRSGARFGPRAIRQAQYTSGSSINSLQLDVDRSRSCASSMPGTRTSSRRGSSAPTRSSTRKCWRSRPRGAIPIVLGGDHSITWPSATAVAEVRRPGSIGIVHFDAHADTAADDWGVLAGHGTPMRRLIESGAVAGRNFVQVGLRGYWPPVEVFEWMKAHGMRYHFMREIEERGADAVIAQAIEEALDGADYVYLSLDIDVDRSGSRARDGNA